MVLYCTVCSKPSNAPAQGEEDRAYKKDGKSWWIVPRMIEILSNVEERPEEERAYAEILNDRCSLVREGRKALAPSGIGAIG